MKQTQTTDRNKNKSKLNILLFLLLNLSSMSTSTTLEEQRTNIQNNINIYNNKMDELLDALNAIPIATRNEVARQAAKDNLDNYKKAHEHIFDQNLLLLEKLNLELHNNHIKVEAENKANTNDTITALKREFATLVPNNVRHQIEVLKERLFVICNDNVFNTE